MKDYNEREKRGIQFTASEMYSIKYKLPKTIMRRGRKRELCISKDAGREEGKYSIWYGTIISGNFVSKGDNLDNVIEMMKEYIEKYKDMDEITFQRLGIKQGICLHHKVKLIKKDTYFYCPTCKLCYEKIGLIRGWLARIEKKIFMKMLGI